MYGDQQRYLDCVIREDLIEEIAFELRTECKKKKKKARLAETKSSFQGMTNTNALPWVREKLGIFMERRESNEPT